MTPPAYRDALQTRRIRPSLVPLEISDDTAAPVSPLDLHISNLAARLQATEQALASVQRRQDEIATLSRAQTAPTPRAIRVLRKRLRSLNMWPKLFGKNGADKGEVLTQARALAAPQDRAFFDNLTPYDAWIEANRPTAASRADLLAAMRSAGDLPRLSIVTPVYNTPVVCLSAMVESVFGQVHEDWELCIADDASTEPETLAYLLALENRDPRVKITRRPKNGGISEATNSAAALASGDALVFVDHDDLITEDCLAEIALYYASHADADIVYSDDDKIDMQGRRYAPQFKPDWSPTLLLSYMYLSHTLSVRRSLFETLGGFRKAFDGSQDYDFALRAAEKTVHVGHIPRVLYHWRATPDSTATSGAAKPESFLAGQRAVQEALDRRGIKAAAIHPDWARQTNVGMFALSFPDEGPSVTVIIPTFNQAGLLRDCLASLKPTTYANYDVLVVDNGSDDPDTLALLAEISERDNHRVARIPKINGVFSFAALMNAAVEQATGELVLLLNDDTRVINPAWMSQMVGYQSLDGVGSVGARLYFEDGSIQHAGIVHGFNDGLVGHAFRGSQGHSWGYMGFVRTAREYSAVTAACVLTPRALFDAVGGFDAENFAVAYNDVDYGFRLVERGLRNIYCAEAELTHLESKSRGYHDNPREAANLRRLYGDWRDPWFNPNLSLDDESFTPSSRRLPMRANRPVRLIAVSHNLNAEGAPNTLFDLVAGLKASGTADPVVLAARDGPLRSAYEAIGVEVRLIVAPLPEPGAFEEGVSRLRSLIEALGGEVVIANTLHMFFAVNAAVKAGVAAIWCQHESEPWETYFNFLAPDVRSHAYAAFAQAYRVTYVADATKRGWAAVQTRHTAQTIRHGVSPKRFAEETGRWSRSAAREALGVRQDEIVISLVGTVCRRKGQMDLVQALAGLASQSPRPIRAFLAGAHPERDYLTQLQEAIAAAPADVAARITVTGPVDDMSVYYAGADIIACTSRIESAPRVLVEAMAFQRAIVTTPVFGIPELVEPGVNALFYEPGDIDALSRAILRLVNDEALREAMAATGPDVLASRPGYVEMIDQYTALVREAALLQDKATPSRSS